MKHKYNTPYAHLLPPLSTEEFNALKADIKTNGIRVEVCVDENDNVLDGHNRLKIDPNAPVKVIRGLSDAQKEAFVFRASHTRRNLSPAQKKEQQKPMKETAQKLRAEDAKKWTQAKVASELGIARETVRDWFAKVTPNGGPAKGRKPEPKPDLDARVTVQPSSKPVIFKRVKAGESQAQVAADFGVGQQQVSRIVTTERKKRDKEQDQAAKRKKVEKIIVDGLKHGDFREVAKTIPDGSVDLIFTDPPYDRKSVPLYGDLAEIGARVLCEGGSLICYAGHYVLPDILSLMTTHLRFWWLLACVHSGQKARMREYGIIVGFKPLLWFVKDTRGDKTTFIDDLVNCGERDKEHHEWGQDVNEASYIIQKLTGKNGFVFDPFCGGGTTAVACKQLDRPFLTCDIDEKTFNNAKARYQDEM